MHYSQKHTIFQKQKKKNMWQAHKLNLMNSLIIFIKKMLNVDKNVTSLNFVSVVLL